MNSRLPLGMVEAMLKEAEGCTMFGAPVVELTRDEAIACMMLVCQQLSAGRDQYRKDLDFLVAL